MNGTLFSYRDIDISRKERIFFQDGQWLNDVCINFALSYFANEVLKDGRYFFFDPAVVSFLNLQMEEEEEYQELRDGLNLLDKQYLFLPLNDNTSFSTNSTHWSLLLCDLQYNEAFHLDSHNNYNDPAARRTLRKTEILLGRSFNLTVVKAPTQSNSYDCGVYSILFAENISRYLQQRGLTFGPLSGDISWLEFIHQEVTPQRVNRYRSEMIKIIDSLPKK